MITTEEFHNLPNVKAAQEVQKRNPYGSPLHRQAYIAILDAAKEHGVDQYFESIEVYDEDARSIAATKS